ARGGGGGGRGLGDGRGRRLTTTAAGRAGEEAAVRYLEAQGYRVLARNYRCRCGEVDIVAADGPFLCFVEVKARRTGAFGAGLEAVDARKRTQVRRVARHYLARLGTSPPSCRFDAVEVWLDPLGRPERVSLVRDAF
ncbi:MAG: YraN family protein, partial [Firmicutes bacterium]|nr:YraN family protein [Bacillota bacterium]